MDSQGSRPLDTMIPLRTTSATLNPGTRSRDLGTPTRWAWKWKMTCDNLHLYYGVIHDWIIQEIEVKTESRVGHGDSRHFILGTGGKKGQIRWTPN